MVEYQEQLRAGHKKGHSVRCIEKVSAELDCRAGESAVRRVIVKLEQVRVQSGEAGAGGE